MDMQTNMRTDRWKRIEKWISAGFLVICLVFCAVLFKAYLDGKFDSVKTLQQYISGFGILAPFILTMIQAAQVVLPVLPGFLGCAAGAVLFGWAGGFWCNYIGISAGSVIAFLLAKRYGRALVGRMFPGKQYERWSAWAAQSRCYALVLFAAMILPLFPDDFFCYFTGITKMSARRFITIIILGKPWCILAYSIFFSGGFVK